MNNAKKYKLQLLFNEVQKELGAYDPDELLVAVNYIENHLDGFKDWAKSKSALSFITSTNE